MSCAKFLIVILYSGMLFSGYSVPVEDMTRKTFGIEYSGLVCGQTIDDSESRFQTHHFMIHYSPISFVLLSTGIGGSSFDHLNDEGKTGFSPTAGLHLVSPKLLSYLAITGGSSVSLINSKINDSSKSIVFVSPDAGILFYIGSILDFSIGVKGHILTGSYSNDYPVRGFLSATLHSSSAGSYATFSFDISPKSKRGWSYSPYEASIGVQVGYLIKTHLKSTRCKNDLNSNCRAKEIDEMIKLQDKMSDEIKERK